MNDGTNPPARSSSPLHVLLAKFSAVGLAATLTYFLVANALLLQGALSPAAASVVGYLAGMVVSFSGQRNLTFAAKGRVSVHLLRFLVLSAMGLLISYGSVLLAVDVLGVPAFWATVVTSVSVPVLSFVVMKYWVFT